MPDLSNSNNMQRRALHTSSQPLLTVGGLSERRAGFQVQVIRILGQKSRQPILLVVAPHPFDQIEHGARIPGESGVAMLTFSPYSEVPNCGRHHKRSLLGRIWRSPCLAGWLIAAMTFGVVPLASAAQPQCCPHAATRTFTVVIGDITGDGIADYAVCDPYGTYPNGGTVALVDGGTGGTLCQLSAPPGEGLFGLSVVPVYDLDGDGRGEIAVVSLVDPTSETPTGIMHVYSPASCKEVSSIKDISQAVVTVPDVRIVGDLSGDKLVDEADLLMLLAGLTGEQVAADPYALDMDKNGIVDFNDAVKLLNLQGTTTSFSYEQTIVAMVNAAEALLDETGYAGNQNQAGEPIQAGINGCVWCAFKCGKWLKKPADCVDSHRTQMNACWDDNVDDYFAISECLDKLRLNFLPTCLANVASAAGSCGKCISKCGPVVATQGGAL